MALIPGIESPWRNDLIALVNGHPSLDGMPDNQRAALIESLDEFFETTFWEGLFSWEGVSATDKAEILKRGKVAVMVKLMD